MQCCSTYIVGWGIIPHCVLQVVDSHITAWWRRSILASVFKVKPVKEHPRVFALYWAVGHGLGFYPMA